MRKLCVLVAGVIASASMAGEPPIGAVTLFDGHLADRWERADGGDVGWEIDDGVLRVAPGTGSIQTEQSFGDALIHIEFRLPEYPEGITGQARANSGVYIQKRYEIQILDSHGQDPGTNTCGAIYGRNAADSDATLPAGQWQRYDIDFRAPRWDPEGNKIANARVTVRLNGTLIHDDVEIEGKTGAGQDESPEPGPLLLQDHGNPIEFRNVWVLPTGDYYDLFDGASIQRWVKKGGKAEYRVEDGAIVGETRPNTPNTFLCTPRAYPNFVLVYEFLVDDELNSGVQIRSLSTPEYQNGRVHGYQVEIDPTPRAYTAGIYDEGRRGWLQDMEDRPEVKAAFRHGQWNQIIVEANGDRIRTWLNGVPAADLTDDMTPNGFIGLQVHGVGDREDPLEVRWRKLRIKTIDDTE